VEIQALMKCYDIDGDGNISYEEFLRSMREELSERRLAMVEAAFSLMDKDGSQVISGKDVSDLYDVNSHPEFQEGTKSKEQIVSEFLDQFDGLRGNNDGKITKQEWVDYYTDLAFSVSSEDLFVRMMEQTWGIAEDANSQEFQTNLRHILALLRQRLLTVSNCQQEEYKLAQLFEEFDVDANGMLTINEVAALLAKLGISVERKFLTAIIGALDENGSGAVEFEEFKKYVIFDPYK
jgi:Ca2+-binding EF-hand superfamily protein